MTNDLIKKLKYSDAWNTYDTCYMLAKYNEDVGEENFFKYLLLTARESNQISSYFNNGISSFIDTINENPFYKKEDVIHWIKSKQLKLPNELIPKDKLSKRSEKSYQNQIGVLLEIIIGGAPGISKHPDFKNEKALITYISDKYEGYDGLSESNLSHQFPKYKDNFKFNN